MADPIHNSLSKFRDTVLTAVACLEFELRDATTARKPVQPTSPEVKPTLWTDDESSISSIHASELDNIHRALQQLTERIATLEAQGVTTQNILTMEPNPGTRNILVRSVHSTPALTAAVAAANPPNLNLVQAVEEEEEEESEEENSVTSASEDEVPVEEEAEEAEEEAEEEGEEEGEVEEEPELKKIMVQGQAYFIDAENVAYTETEDGYEEVGTYNPKTKSIDITEAEAEEEDAEEEAEEMEEFVYKGQTYYTVTLKTKSTTRTASRSASGTASVFKQPKPSQLIFL